MKKKTFIITSLIAISFFSLVACTNEEYNQVIYVSLYPLYEFTSYIANEHYEVINMTPPGGEPHEQELTVKTLKGLVNAKAIFVNGLGLEEWVEEAPSYLDKKIYTVTNEIEPRHADGSADPHVWLNPLNAIKMVESIRDTLVSLDEDNAKDFQTNAEQLIKNLETLDLELATSLENISLKTICVSHAAFGYLTDRYNLSQIAISGLSPEDEPSSSALSSIIEAVKTHGINTIFYEENVSSKIAETIAKETGCLTGTLNPLETLTSEELKEENYFSVLRSNVTKIVKAGGNKNDKF